MKTRNLNKSWFHYKTVGNNAETDFTTNSDYKLVGNLKILVLFQCSFLLSEILKYCFIQLWLNLNQINLILPLYLFVHRVKPLRYYFLLRENYLYNCFIDFNFRESTCMHLASLYIYSLNNRSYKFSTVLPFHCQMIPVSFLRGQ